MMVATHAPTKLSVPEALAHLESFPAGTSLLSAFIDTSPPRIAGVAFLLTFRNAVRAERGRLDPVIVPAFDAAAATVERLLAAPFVPTGRGLAVYVPELGEPIAVDLPAPPVETVVWADHAVVEPLLCAVDDHERYAVVLIDKERTRFFTVAFGRIEERHAFTDEIEGKQATGGWYGLSQKRYARHHEDQVLRHVKHTVGLLTEELRTRPFDRLLIGGTDEALSLLRHHLPKPLAQRLAGTIGIELFASDDAVLHASLRVAEEAERQSEIRLVRDLNDAGRGHAVVGPENTCEALQAGNVSRLVVSEAFPSAGRRCEDCGRLTALQPCPACMGKTLAILDLRERAMERAVQIGARIDIVHGAASDALMAVGGLGAWSRYTRPE